MIMLAKCRCMASSLVRTGFVRGSMTQGNGCYQHRCVNNSLEVCHGVSILLIFMSFSLSNALQMYLSTKNNQGSSLYLKPASFFSCRFLIMLFYFIYFQVAVDGMWKVCPEAGGQIQFPGFNGNYAVLSICF